MRANGGASTVWAVIGKGASIGLVMSRRPGSAHTYIRHGTVIQSRWDCRHGSRTGSERDGRILRRLTERSIIMDIRALVVEIWRHRK